MIRKKLAKKLKRRSHLMRSDRYNNLVKDKNDVKTKEAKNI